MNATLQRLLDAGHGDLLRAFRFGIEKESLRVDDEGAIAQTPHPASLGSALTHPNITTDYSEALLELITPPLAGIDEGLNYLAQLHRYVYNRLGDEYLWSTSMPCVIAGEQSVPIARYGHSNAGQMKYVYRVGLGYRYGRMMQAIAGIHFNFSLPEPLWAALQTIEGDTSSRVDYISEGSFRLIRNLLRMGWLVPFLFGASPAVCKSFLNGRPTDLVSLDDATYFDPFATSLRLGNIGYQNRRESEIGVKPCYDGLDEYIDTLTYAITTAYPGYERIGVKVEGEYRQLNANILQIENEYYATLRPKQVPEWNEKSSLALHRRGVGYIELRSLDVNIYEPLGINAEQLHFLHLLMLYALLEESPRITPWERSEIDKNLLLVAHRGREPDLQLMRNGTEIPLQRWAEQICQGLAPLAAVLDAKNPEQPYTRALAAQQALIEDPSKTPSARLVRDLRDSGETFHAFARRWSLAHRDRLRDLPADPVLVSRFDELVARSLADQRALEASDDVDFDTYLARYFAQ